MRVSKGQLGAVEAKVGPPVGLDHQPGRQLCRHVELSHLARQPDRVAGWVKPGNRPDAAGAGQGSCPEVLRADAVGRHDAKAGDDRGRAHGAGSGGAVSTIALWKPPNPLPTLSTVSPLT